MMTEKDLKDLCDDVLMQNLFVNGKGKGDCDWKENIIEYMGEF